MLLELLDLTGAVARVEGEGGEEEMSRQKVEKQWLIPLVNFGTCIDYVYFNVFN